MHYTDILTFWFEEIEEKQWFMKDVSFDQMLTERFLDTHTLVAKKEDGWGAGAQVSLARIIVLDQFSRNMFRDTPQAFEYDPLALELAEEMVAHGWDQDIPKEQRAFAYMPYMHSESKVVHEEALRLFTELGNEGNLKYEKLHKKIIDRFGRYPHRNTILGRETTVEEQQFLDTDEHASF